MATQNENPSIHPHVDFDDLTKKQQETLRTISEHPDATQANLAEILGVSSATINNRVNSIPGFEWEAREEIITTMFENGTQPKDTAKPNEQTIEELSDHVTDLAQQVATLEQRLDSKPNSTKSVGTVPELAHKIIHACMSSEQISEDEELRILRHYIEN